MCFLESPKVAYLAALTDATLTYFLVFDRLSVEWGVAELGTRGMGVASKFSSRAEV